MNIIIITQGVTPIVKPIINSGYNVVGIIESLPRNYSTPGFYKLIINKLKIYIFKKLRRIHNLELFSYFNGISYTQYKKENKNYIASWIKNKNCELILVYAMSQLLPDEIIVIPKEGVINLHPSLLPKYRGPNPYFWTFYDDNSITGSTVHFINKGEDTGDILLQKQINIKRGITSLQLREKLINEIGVELILKSLDYINEGKITRVSQPKNSPTIRARNISQEEYWELIDWNSWSIERVWSFVTGTNNFITRHVKIHIDKNVNNVRVVGYTNDNNKDNIGTITNSKIVCRDGFIVLKYERK